MTANQSGKYKHVVVDSSAFIERAKLETFGEKSHTAPNVISEIKDRQTKEFVRSLPYTLSIEQPSEESFKWAVNLAKKTGDYTVLSRTDLEVIALTYELYCNVNETEPDILETVQHALPSTTTLYPSQRPPECCTFETPEPLQTCIEPDEDSQSVDSSDSDTDSNEPTNDWITPDNFDEKLASDLGLRNIRLSDDEEAESTRDSKRGVACLTKDFALQNVLLSGGLSILSLNGKLITKPRTNVLWCSACFIYTKKTGIYFCPVCGYPDLRRIPVTLHGDGRLELHFAKKFHHNLRGTKHPITRPKGGKYADEPIYRADQRLPDRRPPRPKHPLVNPMAATNGMLDGLDDDLLPEEDALSSFFPLHDVNSKSAAKGLRADGQVPPRIWATATGLHGLKPTRYRGHLQRPKTGSRRKKLTK